MKPHTEVLSWWGDVRSQITFTKEGQLVALTVGEDEDVVRSLGVRSLGAYAYRPSAVRIDADEVETRGICGDVDVRVRHSFDSTWRIRIGLTNRSEQRLEVGRLLLDVAAGERGVLRVHAAGVLGFLTFYRLADPGCLALRLTRGDLVLADGHVGTPALTLEPGGRYQLTMSGDWYGGPHSVQQRYPLWFPDPLELPASERGDWRIEHPDGAVTLEHPGPEGAASEIVHAHVFDAMGVTHLEVAFADEAGTYEDLARAALARGRVLSAAEGLCVHRAYADQRVGHDEVAALFTDYLLEPPDGPSPLRCVLMTRVVDVGGEAFAVRRATAELAALPAGPGVPLACLSVAAALQLQGESPDVDWIAQKMGELLREDLDAITFAEASLLVGPGGNPSLRQRATRLLEVLGSALPGAVWPPVSDADWARALAVTSFVRPAPGAEPPDAHLPVRRVIARAATVPDGVEALAWLTLRAPTT